MPEMVSATAVDTATEPARPTKLHATLSRMASLKLIERVPTASAMAVAASVEPLTKMVAATSIMDSASNGFVPKATRNSDSEVIMPSPPDMAPHGACHERRTGHSHMG